MKLFAKLSLMRLRFVLMSTISAKDAEVLASDFSTADIEALTALSKEVTPAHVVHVLRKMLEIYSSIGKTHIQSLPLEVVVGEIVG
jgi:hypothetical protein